ncbi:hypothetical protein BDF22DRAFT_679975, partial [Syncephalis plumigaleata]
MQPFYILAAASLLLWHDTNDVAAHPLKWSNSIGPSLSNGLNRHLFLNDGANPDPLQPNALNNIKKLDMSATVKNHFQSLGVNNGGLSRLNLPSVEFPSLSSDASSSNLDNIDVGGDMAN